ncbi:MAG: hypothetical protein V7L27_13625 [Nostoc sp.]|uniref:hypothetical protein n=1 Tax=Nostoc sp. TaxID=1180 RepID=UPI002FF84D47
MQHIPIILVFAYGIDGQDTEYNIRKFWGFVIHPEIPDAILIPRSQYLPLEYIEGGDFRDTLNSERRFLEIKTSGLSNSFWRLERRDKSPSLQRTYPSISS